MGKLILDRSLPILVSWKDSARDWGLGLVFLGALTLVVSAAWVAICAAGNAGPCIGALFVGRQGFLELVGAAVLFTGLILVLIGWRHQPAESAGVAVSP
jgi:hypothetical protein